MRTSQNLKVKVTGSLSTTADGWRWDGGEGGGRVGVREAGGGGDSINFGPTIGVTREENSAPLVKIEP